VAAALVLAALAALAGWQGSDSTRPHEASEAERRAWHEAAAHASSDRLADYLGRAY
jgi:hypothetical protein